jgi:hypothetical protein
MTSDEDFILYDAEPLGSCGRADQIGRAHSDEAESSQKPYSGGAGEGGDEYSEEQSFGLRNKALEGLHGVNEGIDGRLMGIQSQNMMVGINGGGVRLHRRSSAHGKRRDREETSDGGTSGYCKKPGKVSSSDVGMAGGSKKDREEWSDGAISCLLDAYTEKYLQLNRGNLRGNDWDEVATMVSERSDGQKPAKTVDQCKNKVDSLKKRYKTEKSRGMVGATGVTLSYWPWFKKVDQIAGSGAKLNVLSDDEKERVSASVGIVAAAPPPPPPPQPPPPTSSKVPAIASPLPHQNAGGNNNMTLPMQQQAAPTRRCVMLPGVYVCVVYWFLCVEDCVLCVHIYIYELMHLSDCVHDANTHCFIQASVLVYLSNAFDLWQTDAFLCNAKVLHSEFGCMETVILCTEKLLTFSLIPILCCRYLGFSMHTGNTSISMLFF